MRSLAAVLTLGLVVLGIALTTAAHSSGAQGLTMQAARGLVHQRFVRVDGTLHRVPTLSAGTVVSAEAAGGYAAADLTTVPSIPHQSLGCSNRTSGGDVRVNQDCTVRRQAEEAIAVNPIDPNNLIAGQNDSSIGWNHCGFDYSFDGGTRWGSGIPPFYERLNHPVSPHTIAGGHGTGHTYDAASDPSVAFDSRGNAYFSCIMFDIKGNAGGILVGRSPAGAGGSFYNDVPSPAGGVDKAHYVVVEDNSASAGVDKEWIAADSFKHSPYRDSVYVTWTEFLNSPRCAQGGQCSSPIYFSRSGNHGLTWSKPKEISGNSGTLCFDGNLFDPRRRPHDCDLDQGSEPVVLPNGNLVVVFNNGNTRDGNPNQQQLAVVSKDGGRTWSKPALVGRDVVRKEPQCRLSDGPDQCVPGSFVRVDDFPLVAVDRSNGHLYSVWDDYRDGRYDIRLSGSTDGGRSWVSRRHPVYREHGFDQYMAAVAVSPSNHDIALSFYVTRRVPNEYGHHGTFRSGQPGVEKEESGYLLAVGKGLRDAFSVSSLAPSFPPPDGIQAGFNGDYSDLVVVGDAAHPIWSDTRNAFKASTGTFHDEDVFTTTRKLR